MEQSYQPSSNQYKLNNPNSPYTSEVSDNSLHSDKVPYFETVLREKQDVLEGNEVEDIKERVEKEEKNGMMLRAFESFTSIKDSLSRVKESLEGDKDETFVREIVCEESEFSDESTVLLLEEARLISRLTTEVETKVENYKDLVKKEKRELENSLISLTEENRDINNLLRVALLEKEALEKRIKGHDHKRTPLLQFAEFGLQKVGFGFMMGGGNNEQSTDTTSEANNSDSSECDVEAVSLASTVERIMKNLRLEITQLRRSLEESRSDIERLQCLTEEQTKEIAENKLYIKELEDRDRILAQNVEEFLIEIKETEEEVARWKEACELEVKAGKKEIEERDKMVAALKQELQKTKGALDISNGKLRLKEELAMTAIAAQEAAERSLKLADSRGVELRRWVEELTRQLEEVEKHERNSHKVSRRICWPWPVFRLSSSNIADSRIGNAKRMIPEMQSFLQ